MSEEFPIIFSQEEEFFIVEDWYRIPEIQKKDFLQLYKPFFHVEKIKPNYEDPFLKSICDISPTLIRKRKLLEMRLGAFHESMLGKFSGWERLPKNHASGVDIRNIDDCIYIECKNKYNTCNSDNLKEVHRKLQKLRKQGKRSILCQINCPEGKVRASYSNGIEVMNGDEIYELVSGRKDFFEDLKYTFKYVSENFFTYKELKRVLKNL